MKILEAVLILTFALAEIKNPKQKAGTIMGIIRALILFFKIVMFAITGYVGYLIIVLIVQSYRGAHYFGLAYGLLCLSVYVAIVFLFGKTEVDLRI